MENLIVAFAPAFAAALGLQQLIEVLDPVFFWLKEHKGAVLKPLSFVAGLALSTYAGLRVLSHLGYTGGDMWDVLITALIISSGTEGFNSILKFLGYSKEKKSVEVKKEKETFESAKQP